MKILLDTDIIISSLNKKLVLTSLLGKELFISAIVYAELLYGIRKSTNPKKSEEIFERFIKDFSIQILGVDWQIAQVFVDLKLNLERKGEVISDFDFIIAATSKVHDLPLFTANTHHFSRIPGIRLVNLN